MPATFGNERAEFGRHYVSILGPRDRIHERKTSVRLVLACEPYFASQLYRTDTASKTTSSRSPALLLSSPQPPRFSMNSLPTAMWRIAQSKAKSRCITVAEDVNIFFFPSPEPSPNLSNNNCQHVADSAIGYT